MFPRQYCTSVKTVDTMEKLVYILKLAQADISHEEVILNEHKYYHRCKTFKIQHFKLFKQVNSPKVRQDFRVYLPALQSAVPMLKDTTGLRSQKPVIRPKSDEKEQDAGAAEDPGCEGGYSNLHGVSSRSANQKRRKMLKFPQLLEEGDERRAIFRHG